MKVRRTVKMNVNRFEVGDVVQFKLKGGADMQSQEKCKAIAVKQDGDDMIFCHLDCIEKEYRMNPTNCNDGGWDDCELREKINGEILDRYPEKLRSKMVTFENGDYLQIPTEKEIFGENEYGENESDEVTQWEPMKLRRNRIASKGNNGRYEWYWLQNKVSAASFAPVNSAGFALSCYASGVCGVRPVFRIKNR